jgi:hypothetical protein
MTHQQLYSALVTACLSGAHGGHPIKGWAEGVVGTTLVLTVSYQDGTPDFTLTLDARQVVQR